MWVYVNLSEGLNLNEYYHIVKTLNKYIVLKCYIVAYTIAYRFYL